MNLTRADQKLAKVQSSERHAFDNNFNFGVDFNLMSVIFNSSFRTAFAGFRDALEKNIDSIVNDLFDTIEFHNDMHKGGDHADAALQKTSIFGLHKYLDHLTQVLQKRKISKINLVKQDSRP